MRSKHSIVTAFVSVMISFTAFAGVKDEIQKNIDHIDGQISELESLKSLLSKTQEEMKRDLINGIENSIRKDLDPHVKELKQVIAKVGGIPPFVLHQAQVGDLVPAMKLVKASLTSTKSILANIKERFDDEVLEDFDPVKDARHIFEDLDRAIDAFKAVREKLVETRDTWSIGIVTWLGY